MSEIEAKGGEGRARAEAGTGARGRGRGRGKDIGREKKERFAKKTSGKK